MPLPFNATLLPATFPAHALTDDTPEYIVVDIPASLGNLLRYYARQLLFLFLSPSP